MKKPKRSGGARDAIGTLNFWLITLGVVVAAVMAANVLIWYRGGL